MPGQLVEIDSPEENEAIVREIRSRGFQKKQFWMGLTDRGVSDNVDFPLKQNKQCSIYLTFSGESVRLSQNITRGEILSAPARIQEGHRVLESSGKEPRFSNFAW